MQRLKRDGDGLPAPQRASRADTHVVITGRNAPPPLVEAADLVTEMAVVKHPFREAATAQAGVEL